MSTLYINFVIFLRALRCFMASALFNAGQKAFALFCYSKLEAS